jgi:outer membrane protein assembly factor BamB
LRVAATACLAGLLCLSCQNSLYTLASQKKIYDVKVSASRGGLVCRASETPAAALAFTATNNETISLTAVPNKGWVFSGWTVADSGSLSDSAAATTTLTVAGAASTISASFACVVGSGTVGVDDAVVNLLVTITGASTILTTGSAAYSCAATVDGVAVSPASVAWYLDGSSISTSETATIAGASYATGSYELVCEVVYRGYAYSAVRTVLICSAAPGTILWNRATAGNNPSYMDAIGTNGTIYTGGLNGSTAYLYALPADGISTVYFWPTFVASAPSGHPVVAKDGRVALVCGGVMELFKPSSSYTTSKYSSAALSLVNSPAIAPDGAIWVGTTSGYVYKYTDTGTALSISATYNQILTTFGATAATTDPVISSAGRLYIGLTNGRLFAFDLGAGYLWHQLFGSGAAIYTTPAIVGGTIYFGTDDGTVFAIPDSSTIPLPTWTLALSTVTLRSNLVISADGSRLYIVGADTASTVSLYAIDTASGTLRWTATRGGTSYGSPAVDKSGVVYVCVGEAASGTVYALKDWGDSFSTRWSCALPSAPGSSSPIIGGDGTIYAGTSDGMVYAISNGTPAATTGWPMTGRNARHSGLASDAN